MVAREGDLRKDVTTSGVNFKKVKYIPLGDGVNVVFESDGRVP
jgi:hypothetical protein